MVEKEHPQEKSGKGESILAREFAEKVLMTAQENLRRQGSLLPALFLHLESGERALISPDLPPTSLRKKISPYPRPLLFRE